jgi:hypothetical protein
MIDRTRGRYKIRDDITAAEWGSSEGRAVE